MRLDPQVLSVMTRSSPAVACLCVCVCVCVCVLMEKAFDGLGLCSTAMPYIAIRSALAPGRACGPMGNGLMCSLSAGFCW